MDHQEPSISFARRMIRPVVCLTVLVLLGTAAAVAQEDENPAAGTLDDGHYLLDEAGLSPDEAVEAARDEQPGDIDDVDLREKNQVLIYEVEIEGEEIYVDASTGDLLDLEYDNDDDFNAQVKSPEESTTDATQ